VRGPISKKGGAFAVQRRQGCGERMRVPGEREGRGAGKKEANINMRGGGGNIWMEMRRIPWQEEVRKEERFKKQQGGGGRRDLRSINCGERPVRKREGHKIRESRKGILGATRCKAFFGRGKWRGGKVRIKQRKIF